MFCDRCGAEINRTAAACLECGHRTIPYRALPPAAALENLCRQWVAYCRIRLYGGLLLTVQLLAWLHLLDAQLEPLRSGGNARGLHPPDPRSAALAVMFLVGILGIFWAILGFIGTRGLTEGSAAGRRRASLVAAITLLDVPFGTVLAILLLRAIARVNQSEGQSGGQSGPQSDRAKPPAKSQ